MRLFAVIATAVALLAAIFVIVGITSYNWFNVSYGTNLPLKAGQTLTVSSTFSIFGVVDYKMTVTDTSTTPPLVNVTVVRLNHWDSQATCKGDDCTGVTYNINLGCGALDNIKDAAGQTDSQMKFRKWYVGAACAFPKATMAMMALCIITMVVGLPATALLAVDFLPKPIIPLILNGVAWLWLFLAVCVYGGGVSSNARSEYWTDDNAMVLIKGYSLLPDPNGSSFGLGFAYGLPCTAMFLMIIVVALLVLELIKGGDGSSGGGGRSGKEMTRL